METTIIVITFLATWIFYWIVLELSFNFGRYVARKFRARRHSNKKVVNTRPGPFNVYDGEFRRVFGD